MPELWDSLDRAQQPPPAPDMWNAPMGVGSPAEAAGAPSGMNSLAAGLYQYLGNLAKQAFGASEEMRQGGDYNPKPALEAAMLPMGTGAFAGVPLRGGEAVLGSGFVRGSEDAMKPLTEKQFYDQYSQHVDLRGRAGGNADEIQRQIMESGFSQGGNVNTLPPYRGGQPRNIVDMKMAPKAGDTVYLVPNTATTEMGNGMRINAGWKPQPHEILKIAEDYPSLYKEYLKGFPDPFANPNSAGAGVLPATGIRAYHSSPHDFDRFDLSKIGTGEGAQVYGHGLYFAENPAVSGQGGQYWQQFANRFGGDEAKAMEMLQSSKFDRGQAVETAQRQIDELQRRINPGGIFDKPHMADAWRRAQEQIAELSAHRDLLASGNPVGPRTYEVNINADPAHFLDWDKPLREQSIYDAVRKTAPNDLPNMPDVATGSQVYDALKNRLMSRQDPSERQSLRTYAPQASDVLREAGIPGIKYLDQNSRNAVPVLKTDGRGNVISSHYPDPTSNYVVFNPNIIDIMKKYGIAGVAPMAAGFGFPPVGNEQRM